MTNYDQIDKAILERDFNKINAIIKETNSYIVHNQKRVDDILSREDANEDDELIEATCTLRSHQDNLEYINLMIKKNLWTK